MIDKVEAPDYLNGCSERPGDDSLDIQCLVGAVREGRGVLNNGNQINGLGKELG